MFKRLISIVTIIILLGFSSISLAQNEPTGLWSLGVANDSFFDQDRGYTSGLNIAFTPNNAAYTLSIGQDIFTPETRSTLQPPGGEHPYAAWLYLKGDYRYSISPTLLITSSLSLGTTGKRAQGEEFQNFAHQVLNFNEYEGWDSQISQRWGWIAIAQAGWLLPIVTKTTIGVDLITMGQVRGGNIHVDGELGATIRVGYHLPQLEARKRLAVTNSFYITLTGNRKIVDKNVFLEGVSNSDYHVTPKRGVNTLSCGAHWLHGAYQVDLDFYFPEKEFNGQQYTNSYGLLRLSYWY